MALEMTPEEQRIVAQVAREYARRCEENPEEARRQAEQALRDLNGQ